MRLPVILVQNPPASGTALAEALVGNLIGRAGLDLTLVNRFDSLAPDSTDRMTLDGITVPSAVLDWQSPESILQSLSAINFYGVRSPHELDSDHQPTSGSSSRRLFVFDLNENSDAMKIVAELDRLRKSLSVKTVSLGSLGGPKPPATNSPQDSSTARPPVVNSASRTTEPVATTAQPTTPLVSQSDENLDALLDHLDELDV